MLFVILNHPLNIFSLLVLLNGASVSKTCCWFCFNQIPQYLWKGLSQIFNGKTVSAAIK